MNTKKVKRIEKAAHRLIMMPYMTMNKFTKQGVKQQIVAINLKAAVKDLT